MARPKQYTEKRLDTKVRLREDHRRLLAEYEEENGVGRNRVIELALDRFFDLRSTAPRLKRAPADPKIVKPGAAAGTTRTRPRIAHVGEAAQAQAERNAAPVPVVRPRPAKHKPRRPQ